MKSSQRIIVNTISQYIRTFVNTILALLATRVILNALGEQDYGIYTLIAGVVTILSFITASLSATTQRFLSVYQGKGNSTDIKKIFNNSLIIHILLGIVFVVVFFSIYQILFNNFLNVPENRLDASKFVFLVVIFITFLSFLSAPYKASIIAHENIVFISIVEVLDAILKLLIAILLSFTHFDKLITYASLLLLVQVCNIIIVVIYSCRKYQECNIIPSCRLFDKNLSKNILSFATWTMYDVGCVYGRTQGIALVLNHHMGPVINAAYGISLQVSGGFCNFSAAFMNAMNPQLMKSEGSGNRNKMLRMAEIESKFAYYLITLFSIPAFFEIEKILSLWLGNVPLNTVLFCKMTIIASSFDMLTMGLTSANSAKGNIKYYTLIVSTIKLSTIFFIYFILLSTENLTYVAVVYVSFEVLSGIARIPISVHNISLSFKNYLKNVLSKVFIPTIIFILACFLLTRFINFKYRLLLTITVPVLIYIISIYLWGLCEDEKLFINNMLLRLKKIFILK